MRRDDRHEGRPPSTSLARIVSEASERPFSAWAYLTLASGRMYQHERRREARWRRMAA